MSQSVSSESSIRLRDSSAITGFGALYALRSVRVWWYSAWLRTLARFSRTFFGSFWLGLSNLLSVALLSVVYGTVLKVPDPLNYAIYLGIGLTAWGFISQSMIAGCSLFSSRRDQLVNNGLPALFYCLEEWAFQIQTFGQAFAIIILAFAIIKPVILLHSLLCLWLPLINLFLFCLLALAGMAVLGARFKDIEQLTPIVLQLLFLLSPILYKRDGLGSLAFLADFNPLYRVLHSIRAAIIDGKVNEPMEMITFIVVVSSLLALFKCLKLIRYKLPLWA
jgi:ABC-type polysaccharide/polyol phosphate export permease